LSLLRAENLTKTYHTAGAGAVRAVRGVTLSAARGEFLAVMGASGSGKSTLLHLLGGLDTPDSGKVFIEDVSIHEIDDDDLTRFRRHKIGFVFQFYNLLPNLTARENIAVPLLIAGRRDDGKVDEVLRLVGLTRRADHRPDELSGGEQQRVAIARALVMNPPLILADEPTGNLDSRNAEQIYTLLRRLAKELSRAVVMVTHDALGAAHADRILFLADGRIVGETTTGADTDAASVAAMYEKLVHA